MGNKKKKSGKAALTVPGQTVSGQITSGQEGEEPAEAARGAEAETGGGIDLEALPPPELLVRKKDARVKITITLNSESVEFFKKCARKNGVKYQTMINGLLDSYAWRYRDRAEGE